MLVLVAWGWEGGYDWFTGAHALTIDNIIQLEVVLASGRIVPASSEQNSDLDLY